ncbi:MAG: SBBP repeat-containing protein, partial [Planctomycetota bacterium]
MDSLILQAVSVNASGVYVAGYTRGTFPGETSGGFDDVFIRKYDFDGNELWTRQFGGPDGDSASAISADGSGVYVAGQTLGTLPGQTSSGSFDAFVCMYFDGTEVWTRQFGSPSVDGAFGISADGSGVYVAGYTGGTLPGQTRIGAGDAFVRMYDFAGTEVWTRQFGTARNDRALAISTNPWGVYVAGETAGTLPGQTRAGLMDAFVCMYDFAGTEVWPRQFGTSGNDFAWGISVDTSGVYAAGFTNGTFPGETSGGSYDAFAAKLILDSDGDGIPDDEDNCPYEDATGLDADNDGCIDSFGGLV